MGLWRIENRTVWDNFYRKTGTRIVDPEQQNDDQLPFGGFVDSTDQVCMCTKLEFWGVERLNPWLAPDEKLVANAHLLLLLASQDNIHLKVIYFDTNNDG